MTKNTDHELYKATLFTWSDIPLTIRFHLWHFWYGLKFRRALRLKSRRR
jgi:hypothetical protein